MTFRSLFIFIFIFVLISGAITSLGSRSLITQYEKSSNSDFIEQVFAALEAGPLALARLHASNISNEHLDRLVKQINSKERAIYNVSIASVGNEDFVYANWKSHLPVSNECKVTSTKIYKFADAISDFKIDLAIDKCAHSQRLRSIMSKAQITFLIISSCLFIGLILLFLPLLISLQKANRIISGGGNPNEIPFIPVRKIVAEAIKARILETNAKKFELAKQVAHDIRSPLSALEILYASLNRDEKSTDLLLSASSRIKAIANSLLHIDRVNYNAAGEICSMLELNKEIERVVQEAAIVAPSVNIVYKYPSEINFDKQYAFEKMWLARIISNLINNSIEAAESSKKTEILVDLKQVAEFAIVKIIDNGIGMSSELIEKVLTTQYSTKASGYGLGIQNARKKLTEWDGKLEIKSVVGDGTTVVLSFRAVD